MIETDKYWNAQNCSVTQNKTLQGVNVKTRLIWGDLNKVMTYR